MLVMVMAMMMMMAVVVVELMTRARCMCGTALASPLFTQGCPEADAEKAVKSQFAAFEADVVEVRCVPTPKNGTVALVEFKYDND